MPAIAERQRHQPNPEDAFIRLFDRGLGREITEEALKRTVSQTLEGKFPHALRDTNVSPREFYRRTVIFNKLLEQSIVRVGQSHVAKKDHPYGFSFRFVRAKKPYIQLNLDPFATFKAPETTFSLEEDNPLNKFFKNAEKRAELILVESILTSTQFYQNLIRSKANSRRNAPVI